MKAKILLVLFTAAFLVHFKTEAQTVPAADSLALVNLYDSTGGTSWTTHTNWLTKTKISSWYGVTVSAGRVVGLNLDETSGGSIVGGNNMSGALPRTMGNLTAIRVIELDFNTFDSIPYSWGNMTALDALSLQIDGLGGEIPPTLGNLSNLTFLALYYNNFADTIPSSLGNLSKLQSLYLGQNLLGGVIPSSLGNITTLETLDLDGNGIGGTIPTTFSNLTNLTYLDLDYNVITGSIPTTIGNLTKLTYLDLNTNLLSGAIPSTISNLTGLTYLDLYDNSLTGTIPSLTNFNVLATLDLGFNQLTGTIPSTLGNLTDLTLLSLGYNNITGSVPASLGSLTKLTYLDLSSDQLSDSIPSTLDGLTALTVCQLPNNEFTFAGMEGIASKYAFALYAPQANIPIHQNGHVLSVSAGGTLSNNTYDWYLNDVLLTAITGDSTLTMTSTGTYQVVVNNAIATTLTLYSDSIVINSLPVKLLNFTGALQKNKVNLNWKTTNEVNAQTYVIERSTDGINFSQIGSVPAIDISAETNSYAFADVKPVAGADYYKLKMVDKDGQFTYSNIVRVNLSAAAFALSIYPNPVTSGATVSFTATSSANYTVKVTDVSGRLISFTNAVSTVGANTVNIDCSKYGAGTYFATYEDANGKQTLEFTK